MDPTRESVIVTNLPETTSKDSVMENASAESKISPNISDSLSKVRKLSTSLETEMPVHEDKSEIDKSEKEESGKEDFDDVLEKDNGNTVPPISVSEGSLVNSKPSPTKPDPMTNNSSDENVVTNVKSRTSAKEPKCIETKSRPSSLISTPSPTDSTEAESLKTKSEQRATRSKAKINPAKSSTSKPEVPAEEIKTLKDTSEPKTDDNKAKSSPSKPGTCSRKTENIDDKSETPESKSRSTKSSTSNSVEETETLKDNSEPKTSSSKANCSPVNFFTSNSEDSADQSENLKARPEPKTTCSKAKCSPAKSSFSNLDDSDGETENLNDKSEPKTTRSTTKSSPVKSSTSKPKHSVEETDTLKDKSDPKTICSKANSNPVKSSASKPEDSDELENLKDKSEPKTTRSTTKCSPAKSSFSKLDDSDGETENLKDKSEPKTTRSTTKCSPAKPSFSKLDDSDGETENLKDKSESKTTRSTTKSSSVKSSTGKPKHSVEEPETLKDKSEPKTTQSTTKCSPAKSSFSKLDDSDGETENLKDKSEPKTTRSTTNSSPVKSSASKPDDSDEETETLKDESEPKATRSKANSSLVKSSASKPDDSDEETENLKDKSEPKATRSKANSSPVKSSASKPDDSDEETENLKDKSEPKASRSKVNSSPVKSSASKPDDSDEETENLKDKSEPKATRSKANFSPVKSSASKPDDSDEETENLKDKSEPKATRSKAISSPVKSSASKPECSADQSENLKDKSEPKTRSKAKCSPSKSSVSKPDDSDGETETSYDKYEVNAADKTSRSKPKSSPTDSETKKCDEESGDIFEDNIAGKSKYSHESTGGGPESTAGNSEETETLKDKSEPKNIGQKAKPSQDDESETPETKSSRVKSSTSKPDDSDEETENLKDKSEPKTTRKASKAKCSPTKSSVSEPDDTDGETEASDDKSEVIAADKTSRSKSKSSPTDFETTATNPEYSADMTEASDDNPEPKATCSKARSSPAKSYSSKPQDSVDEAEATADKTISSKTKSCSAESESTGSKPKNSNVETETSDNECEPKTTRSKAMSSPTKSKSASGKLESCDGKARTSSDLFEDNIVDKSNCRHESTGEGPESTAGIAEPLAGKSDQNSSKPDNTENEFATLTGSSSQDKSNAKASNKNIFSSLSGNSFNQKSSDDSGIEEQCADSKDVLTISALQKDDAETADDILVDGIGESDKNLSTTKSPLKVTPRSSSRKSHAKVSNESRDMNNSKSKELNESDSELKMDSDITSSCSSSTLTKDRNIFEECVQNVPLLDNRSSSTDKSKRIPIIDLGDSSDTETVSPKKNRVEDDLNRYPVANTYDLDHSTLFQDNILPVLKLFRCSDISPVTIRSHSVGSDVSVEEIFNGSSPLVVQRQQRLTSGNFLSSKAKRKAGPKSSKLSSTKLLSYSSDESEDSSPIRYPKRKGQSAVKPTTQKKPGPKSSKQFPTKSSPEFFGKNQRTVSKYPLRGTNATPANAAIKNKYNTPGPKSSKRITVESSPETSDDESDHTNTKGKISKAALKRRKVESSSEDSDVSEGETVVQKRGRSSKKLSKMGPVSACQKLSKTGVGKNVGKNKRRSNDSSSGTSDTSIERIQKAKRKPDPKTRVSSPEELSDSSGEEDNTGKRYSRRSSKMKSKASKPKSKASAAAIVKGRRRSASVESFSDTSGKSEDWIRKHLANDSKQKKNKSGSKNSKHLSDDDDDASVSSEERVGEVRRHYPRRLSNAEYENPKSKTVRKGWKRPASVSSCSDTSERSVERIQKYRKKNKPGPKSSQRLSEEVISVSSQEGKFNVQKHYPRRSSKPDYEAITQKSEDRKTTAQRGKHSDKKMNKHLSEEEMSVSSEKSDINMRKQYPRRSSNPNFDTSKRELKKVETSAKKRSKHLSEKEMSVHSEQSDGKMRKGRKRVTSVESISDGSDRSEEWVRTHFESDNSKQKSKASAKGSGPGNRKRLSLDSGSEMSEKSEDWARTPYPRRASAPSSNISPQKPGPKRSKQFQKVSGKSQIPDDDFVQNRPVFKNKEWANLPSLVSARNQSQDHFGLLDDPCTCFLWDQNITLPGDYDRSSFPVVRLCGASVKECSICARKLGKQTKPKLAHFRHAPHVRKATRSHPQVENDMFTESEGSEDGTGSQKTTKKIREGLTNEEFDTRQWLQSLLVNVDDRESSPSPAPETTRQTRSKLSWTLSTPGVSDKSKSEKLVKDRPRSSPKISSNDKQSEGKAQKSKLRGTIVHGKRSEIHFTEKPITKSKKLSPTEDKLEKLLKRAVDLVNKHAKHLAKNDDLQAHVAFVDLCDVEHLGGKSCTVACKRFGKKARRPSAENLSKSLGTETLFTDSEDESHEDHVVIDVLLSDEEEEEDNNMTSFLCDLCGFSTTTKIEFQDHCKSCKSKMNSLFTCTQKSGDKDKKETTSKENKKSSAAEPYRKCVEYEKPRHDLIRCGLCPEEFISERSRSIHINRQHVSKVQEPFLRCPHCVARFDTKEHLLSHMSNRHPELVAQIPGPVKTAQQTSSIIQSLAQPLYTTGLYSCEKCGETFKNVSDVQNHRSQCSIQVEILAEFTPPNVEVDRMRQELDYLKKQESALKKNIESRQSQLQNYRPTLYPGWQSAVEQLSKEVTAGVAAGVLSVYPNNDDPAPQQQEQQGQCQQADIQVDNSSSSSSQLPGATRTTSSPFPTGLFARIDRTSIPVNVEKNMEQCLVCGKIFTDKSFLMKHILRRNHGHPDQPIDAVFNLQPPKPVNSKQADTGGQQQQQQQFDENVLQQQQHTEITKEHKKLQEDAKNIKKSKEDNEKVQIHIDYLKARQREIAEEERKAKKQRDLVKEKEQELKGKARQTDRETASVKKTSEETEAGSDQAESADELQTVTSTKPQNKKSLPKRRRQKTSFSQTNKLRAKNKEKRAAAKEVAEEEAMPGDSQIDPQDLWECNICNKFFLTQGYLLKHTAGKHPEELNKTSRGPASSQVPSAIVYDLHVATPNPVPKTRQRRAKTNDPGHKTPTKNGEKVAKNSGNLTSFMSSISFSESPDVVLECTHCEQTFNSPVSLNEHLNREHS